MDSEVSSNAKKHKTPEHVLPEIVSKPANVCGHCSKRYTSKALLAKQYSVTYVDFGFMLLVRV